jgi:hypothetical protein
MERVDQIIKQLEELHKQAHEIFDARVEVILSHSPYGTSVGATKVNAIFAPAGSTLNYVKALQNLRDGKTAK